MWTQCVAKFWNKVFHYIISCQFNVFSVKVYLELFIYLKLLVSVDIFEELIHLTPYLVLRVLRDRMQHTFAYILEPDEFCKISMYMKLKTSFLGLIFLCLTLIADKGIETWVLILYNTKGFFIAYTDRVYSSTFTWL